MPGAPADHQKPICGDALWPVAGAVSLREIVGRLQSHAARLYHLGARTAAACDPGGRQCASAAGVFSDLFAQMAGRAHRATAPGLGRDHPSDRFDRPAARRAQRAIGRGSPTGVCGAKLHIIYDPDADRPIYAAITAANVNDITAAKAMPIEPGATYVFDLGYYDYAWWAKLDAARCRIVTRLKSNTPLTVVEELPVPAGGAILVRSDRPSAGTPGAANRRTTLPGPGARGARQAR